MFEQFSRGYYLGRLYVEPHDDAAATMCREQHERVNRQLYTTGDGVERTDLPLVMKLGSQHFTVHGDDGVPADTLAVPRDLLEDHRFENPPDLREVFLAKADHAQQLLSVSADTPENGPFWNRTH
ncbi:DUF5802 family protein [Haloarcula sp. GH36]|uniref:DUF5802 family protein n=1 Tax=Haloarcula montana TaxID=3111776 RepID=UPI002D768C73|nr:DUF5802 family protein [Haloarcula sp. GH36]